MDFPRRLLLSAAGVAAIRPGAVSAQPTGATRQGTASANTIRIGVLSDMSGPYRDVAGPTSVACVRQAVAEFTAGNPGIKVEVLAGDHLNKADLGASMAREWFDRNGVDALADVSNSAVALAVGTICVEKDKVQLNTGGGSSEITGRGCNANTTHWTYDTWCNAHSTGGGLVQKGGDRWFFVTADYTFGKSIQADTTRFIQGAGGRVLGSVSYPFPGTSDFSSLLVQAQSSGANVVAFANAGADLVNCVKQAGEFGVGRRNVRLAAMVGFIQDVNALGLEAAQGLTLTELFYWDLDERTRAFLHRIKPQLPNGLYPNQSQASAYSATLHYLKAVQQLGPAQAKASGRAVVELMKRMPTDDDAFGAGSIRVDGRVLRPAHLFEVKRPSESRGSWDYYKLISTTPAQQAFRPLDEGGCPLVRR